jgi:hypothetical protein
MTATATPGTADAPAGDARELGRTYSEWFDAGERGEPRRSQFLRGG